MFQSCCLVLSLLLMGVLTITGCAGRPTYILSTGDTLKMSGNTEIKTWAGDIGLYGVVDGRIVGHLNFYKWIELRNGTRYVCKDPGGCSINFAKGGVITKGTIAVYKK